MHEKNIGTIEDYLAIKILLLIYIKSIFLLSFISMRKTKADS